MLKKLISKFNFRGRIDRESEDYAVAEILASEYSFHQNDANGLYHVIISIEEEHRRTIESEIKSYQKTYSLGKSASLKGSLQQSEVNNRFGYFKETLEEMVDVEPDSERSQFYINLACFLLSKAFVSFLEKNKKALAGKKAYGPVWREACLESLKYGVWLLSEQMYELNKERCKTSSGRRKSESYSQRAVGLTKLHKDCARLADQCILSLPQYSQTKQSIIGRQIEILEKIDRKSGVYLNK